MNIAIYGYGNLGKGVEIAIKNASDMILVGIFTRRDPKSIKTLTGAPVYSSESLKDFSNKIDVLIICGGSATDLPILTPELSKNFNVIDSFDTHKNIPLHFANVDKVAKENNHVALISAGWDPGTFSIARLYANAILPNGNDYTFWGKGISQGHSDAIRRIDGVKDARQYTVPVESALESVRNGENPTLSTRQKHTRECYVVLKDGADAKAVEAEIKNMPNYFADYDTTVNFITQEELDKNHSGMPHGGSVIRTGTTGLESENSCVIEYSLKLGSNPEFTASVLVAYARAVYKMYKNKNYGCKTVFDVPPIDLLEGEYMDVLAKLL
ncbi:MAG: diaminopimelate dehydrogenase [Clostridia bacterium]|nr:diaminopimelate dehydrogenase [Clostridia bacterium]